MNIKEKLEATTVFERSQKLVTVHHQELNQFLELWDKNYKLEAQKIKLFDINLTKHWSDLQRKHFIRIFYHSRGHFSDFLFHLGNFCPNKFFKTIILENIVEEFGGDYSSHEQLYLDFALNEGVNLNKEHIENNYYTESMKEFNKIHLEWLYNHEDWNSKLSAFSAYERLDSTDYELLSNALFKDPKQEHIFFKIHREAEHFDKTYTSLMEAWQKNKDLVEEAFNFVANLQLDMWRNLSDETFSLS